MTESKPKAVSTTVERAGALLKLLVENPDGLGVAALTRELDTQRAPLYRILEALQRHQLVRRDERKRYLLGAGTLELAHAFSAQFERGVESLLRRLADETALTASLLTADGHDTLTTIMSITPSTVAEHVFTPPGFRHPAGKLASRVALYASRPPEPDEWPEVAEARERGYAVATTAASIRYAVSVVVPGTAKAGSALVLTLLSINEFDDEAAGDALLRAVPMIGVALASSGYGD
ncbi:MAG: helix-turn-helix domain-containing protein [Pseudoclavibacter sp.]